MLQLYIVLLVVAFTNRQSLAELLNSTSPKYDVCFKLDLSYGIDHSSGNTIELQNCSNVTTFFDGGMEDELSNYHHETLLNETQDVGPCVVVRSRNSSTCHIVNKLHVFTYGRQSWIAVTNSTLSSCSDNNVSLSVCLPNDDKLCVCKKWYHVESDCAYENDNDTTYHFFFNPLRAITELPATINITPVCRAPNNLIERIRAMFMLILVVISVMSLVSSVTIHLILFRNSHEVLPLLCHKITLLVCYIIFLIRSFRPYSKPIACINGALYFASQCAFLSSFFWLNVLAFEMWRQFHPKRILRAKIRKNFRWRKLVLQSLYGWGAPIVLTVVYCLLRRLNDVDLFMYKGDCPIYFQRNVVQVIYIAVVNETALLISIILFVLIVINMKTIKASVAAANNNQQMFWTYVKLMTLASFSVIFYVLKDAIPPRGKDQLYWVPADIFICLHGFLLFLMDCCCNSNARTRMKKSLVSISFSTKSTSINSTSTASTSTKSSSTESSSV